ncbi:hypothetical protein Mapa_004420 [Marchantia paleacea]|nr:hypothetical protein Mapa_004420 [Marchantia paleacea]
MGVSCRPRHAKSPRPLLQGEVLLQVFVFGLLFHVAHHSAAEAAQEFETAAADAETFRARSKSLVNVAEQMDSKVEKDGGLNFTLSDGDEVSCVPIKKQPSLTKRMTGRRTVPLQLSPSSSVKRRNSTASSRGAKIANQTFQVEVGSCPNGTIPVRRSRDIYNLTDLFFETQFESHFFGQDDQDYASTRRNPNRRINKHAPPSFSQPSDGNYTEANESDSTPHQHAFVIVNTTESIKGMEVILNIWEPYVEYEDEFSLAQFWLISGSYKGKNVPVGEYSSILNTIEAGWQVFEGLYGDNRSRLFLFWTADAYNDTGCYNLYCYGFVQVSNKVLVGGSFTPISQVNSTQYEIDLLVFRQDNSSGNWWLLLNDEPVGYWPSELFTSQLRDSATYIEFGGEIIDDESTDGHRHTKTKMGSGYYPQAGHKFAAYQRNIQYVDENLRLNDATLRLGHAEAPTCYNALISTEFPEWGANFYYGGRGFSMICPHNA